MTPRRTRPRVERLDARDLPSVTFRFDYSLDTSGFFAAPERRAALEQAGFVLTNQLNDTLSAVRPSGSNTWSVSLTIPATGQTVTKPGLAIAADEIVVYATGSAFPGGQLGYTAPTTYTATGSPEWVATVKNRGEAAGEFAPWGGLVSFGTGVPWHFGSGTPPATAYDFRSAAQHELLHILGFGAGNPAFERLVSGGLYRGAYATAIAGAAIPVVGAGGHADHWAAGVRSHGAVPVMAEHLRPGETRLATALDYAVLADLGWQVDLIPADVPPGTMTPIGTAPNGDPLYTDSRDPSPMIPVVDPSAGPFVVAVGAGEGSPPTVTGYDAKGRVAFSRTVFDPTYTGGVRVAVADFNGDGTPDLVVGTGVGTATFVRVLNGTTGGELFSVAPFESRYRGGVFLAAGDITGDGRADLAIAAGAGGGPRVRVFGGAGLAQLADFFTIEDANFRGGTRPALADFTGDGRADLAVAAGAGGGPRVAVYDGVSFVTGPRPRKLLGDFYVGDVAKSDGAYLATGDTNGDGTPDLIASAGPTVTVFDGRDLGRNRRTTVAVTISPATADSRGGARIAAADVNNDGKADILTFATLRSTPTQAVAYSGITRQILGFDI
jgi:hypothetical protein